MLLTTWRGFNPHPTRRLDATAHGHADAGRAHGVSIPSPTRRLDATTFQEATLGAIRVSILTQPAGWMQHILFQDYTNTSRVSILTQPEGWMQLYQPRPAWRNAPVSILTQPAGWMQPHHYVRLPLHHCFNPHPTRRLDATGCVVTLRGLDLSFNPHPTRRLDATLKRRPQPKDTKVSILTQPAGWMQRG